MSFYSNSPQLVDDIPSRAPAEPERKPTEPEREHDELTGGYFERSDEDRARSMFDSMREKLEPSRAEAPPKLDENDNDMRVNADGSVEFTVPDHIRALRNAPERRMFTGAKNYCDINFAEMPDGAPPEVERFVHAMNGELRECLGDMELSTGDAKQFATLLREAAAKPPTEEQQLKWRQETIDVLNREFGRQAAQALTDAHALAMRDPRVQRMILVAGLGDHPELIKMLVRAAKDQKSRGRLPHVKRGEK